MSYYFYAKFSSFAAAFFERLVKKMQMFMMELDILYLQRHITHCSLCHLNHPGKWIPLVLQVASVMIASTIATVNESTMCYTGCLNLHMVIHTWIHICQNEMSAISRPTPNSLHCLLLSVPPAEQICCFRLTLQIFSKSRVPADKYRME